VRRYAVLLLSVVLFVDAALFGALIPLLPELKDAHDLGKTEAGLLFGAFAAGALLSGIPAGLIARRVVPRRTVIAGLVFQAAATLAFALVEDPLSLGIARFAQGVGSIVTWTGGLEWIATATPRDRRGQALGTAFGTAIFGFIVGPVIGALARETSTFGVFLGLAVLTLALAVLMSFQPEAPPEEPVPGALPRVLRDERFVAGLWLTCCPRSSSACSTSSQPSTSTTEASERPRSPRSSSAPAPPRRR